MPALFSRYKDRSAEHRLREAALLQKRQASWNKMKADVARKYNG